MHTCLVHHTQNETVSMNTIIIPLNYVHVLQYVLYIESTHSYTVFL